MSSMGYLLIFVEINTNIRCDNDGSGFLERGEFREVCGGLGIAKVFSSSHFTLEEILTCAVGSALPRFFIVFFIDGAVLTD